MTHYSEGICGDGAAILRDGVMTPVEEVVATLNSLRAEVERLKKDQHDWRKGVELIASGLGERNPPDLSCVRINMLALELRAKVERLKTLLDDSDHGYACRSRFYRGNNIALGFDDCNCHKAAALRGEEG